MIDPKSLEAASEAVAVQFDKDMDAPSQVFAGVAITAYLASEREAGRVMVPVEATDAMMGAVCDTSPFAQSIYAAMIAARPNGEG